MTDRTAVPERVTRCAKTARRGGGSGPQVVGDYVGQPAGEAAQAVRRAGLRPGLDRSFGCPAELTGLVVAQDPAAGSGLARNGMVTLYVAAPGGGPIDGDAEFTSAASSAAEGELRASAPADDSPGTTPVPARPRRRKQGLAQCPPAAAEPSPAPAIPRESASEPVSAQGAVEPLGECPPVDAPVGALEGALAEGSSAAEFSHDDDDDDFVVHVEDVLAGRSGPIAWRRAYPRWRVMCGLGSGGAVRAWIGEHRKLAGTIGTALALWTVIGVSSALDGHHARSASASTVAPSTAAPDPSHRAPSPEPAPAQNSNAHKAPAGPARSHRSRPGSSRAASRGPVRRHAPRAAAPVPAPSRAPVPSASTASSSPAPEQTGGGLFSP